VIRVIGWRVAVCDNVIAWIDLDRGGPCGRIRIERKAPLRDHRDRYAVLPLDPVILRAKLQLRRGAIDRAVPVGAAGV